MYRKKSGAPTQHRDLFDNNVLSGSNSNLVVNSSESSKKNPGALAGATEAELCKADGLRSNSIPKRKRLSISKHADLNHKIAGKVICDGLVMGHDFDAWADVMAVLAVRLTVPERAMIAWAVLKGLPDDAVAGIIDTVAPVPEPEPAPAHVIEAAIEYRAASRSVVLHRGARVTMPDDFMQGIENEARRIQGGNYRLPDPHHGARECFLSKRAAEIKTRLVSLSSIDAVLTDNYMVKGWLDRNCLSMLYGPSNAGKTFVALDVAMHIAAGQSWRGLRVNGGPVLYVAAEGGNGIRNRLAAIVRDRPEMASAPFTLLPTSLDLHAPGDAQAICEIIPDEAPALVVIDTLARSMGAGDENTAKDAAMFVRNCDLIRESTGAHVMVIHHTGKDEERGARGSSALRSAVDNEIQVTAEGEIVSRKQRDRQAPGTLHFKLRSVTLGVDEDGDPVTSAVVEPAEAPAPERKPLKGKNEVAMQALYDALRDHGETKVGSSYPGNRKAVHVDRWREACDAHGLTTGVSDSAARTAFMRAKTKLMDMDEVREFGGFVWRVREND